MEELFELLTDDLLIHIISFLPTKDAVLTSVLSKRWKLLWCYAQTCLVLDDSVSFSKVSVGYNGHDARDRVVPFANFVDTVLKLLKVPQVDTFSLKMCPFHKQGFNPVLRWLHHIVTTKQAKEIQLHFSLPICLNLSGVFVPFQTFNSSSLQVLKLYFDSSGPLRSTFPRRRLFLPNLKILHIWMDGINIKWQLLKALFRASPQLEEVYFGGCIRKPKFFYNIVAPSLKRLRMKFLSAESSSTKFLIKAPMLEELLIVDESFQQHVIKTTSNCPVNAKLDIGVPFVRKFPELHTHIRRVSKLLRSISHVKSLNLRAHTMDTLSIHCNGSGSSKLPQFPALFQLKLCFLNYSSWDVIPKLLESSPNLQVLVIGKDFKGKDAQFRADSVWIQPSSVPVGLASNLRHVEVRDCESHQAEFNLISYLLEHGDALSTFLVELLPVDSRDDLRFKQKLLLIPRVAKTCELKISVYPHSSQQRPSFQDEEKVLHHPAKLEQQRMPFQEMCFEDLRVCTNDFSDDRLLIRTKKCEIYRGKLHQPSSFDSPVRDVVVKKLIIKAGRCDNERHEHKEELLCTFREELKFLEHPNIKYHSYFVNMLGCCAEDNNELLGTVYDFKPLDCLDNLIHKDSFTWLQRMKVALVLACILEYMHKKHDDLPFVTARLCPSSVILDEDYIPKLFNFNRRYNYYRGEDQYDKGFKSMYEISRRDAEVDEYGRILLGLISKGFHECPSDKSKSKCRMMHQWAWTQYKDRYTTSSLCKSQIPLVHTNLMDDSSYDIADGLKITGIAMRCVGCAVGKPSMHAIVKYLCKLRVVRENWDVLDADNILRDH